MNMLSPKKTKFRKQFKGRIHGSSKGNYALNYGSYGLKAIEPERITSRQIEAARKAITRYLKRAGRMWIRIFPDVPVSKKPAEVRMGKGKGSVEYWACRVKPGRIMFEVEGHERNVLQGGIETVKNNKPVLLVEIEERHTKTPITEIITFINSIGYKAFISRDNDLIEIDKVRDLKNENNFFFLPLDHKLIQSFGQ